MSVLILAEHDNQTLHPTVPHVLAAAMELSDNPIVLIVGYQCDSVVQEASLLKGVVAVWQVDAVCYEHPLAEQIGPLVAELADSFSYILSSATTYGKNLLPRVAALLDVAQISDVIRMVSADTFVHPIYAGNAIETVQALDDKKVLTIRTTAFDPIVERQVSCSVKRIDKTYEPVGSSFVGQKLSDSSRPELGSAKVIVSGGRGLQSAEKFKLIEDLADVLGAAVGASRAAVDSGFVPNDYQVGQTGKVVAPTLYIAVGISGAIQHLAGMKDSKVIVAINKDEDAPIFQIADYGLVGDLFELVPELIQQLKALRDK